MTNSVAKYGKRDCFSTLQKFVAGSYDGKICILYGLRRTGKTTLLFQMLSDLPIEKTAYIKVQTTDDMSRLTKDLKVLFELGYRYVFIDEITLLNDFIDTAAVLYETLPPACWHIASVQVPLAAATFAVAGLRMTPAESIKTK